MNVIDLNAHAPLSDPDPKTIDMLPPRWEEPGVRALRSLSLLILVALRDGGDSYLLRTAGESATLWVSVDVRWVEMPPVPIHLARLLQGLVWFLGRPRRRAWDAAGLLRLLDRREPVDPGPPWGSRFRARLGEATADVVARAEAIPGAVDLILDLVDVTIGPSAAAGKLLEVFPK
jgi:hypothetical protein